MAFFDENEARKAAFMRKSWMKTERETRLNLSNYPRICIPFVLITRPVEALLRPIHLAGPNAVKWLERYLERPGDSCDLSPARRILRSVAQWLIEEPNSGPDTIEDDADLRAVSLAFLLGPQGLHPETHMPPAVGQPAAGEIDPNDLTAAAQSEGALVRHTSQGVH